LGEDENWNEIFSLSLKLLLEEEEEAILMNDMINCVREQI